MRYQPRFPHQGNGAGYAVGLWQRFTAGIGEIGIESVEVGLSGALSSVWTAVEELVFITTVT